MSDKDEDQTLAGIVGQNTEGESDLEITENDDGSASVSDPAKPNRVRAFYDNLAEDMDRGDLDMIAVDLLELIDKDKQDRARRDEQYSDGMKRMGLDKETVGGANFDGASNVVHPMYTKACIDFEARSIKEMFPPGGPVREYIPGSITDENSDRASRKAKWMNFQLTQLMPNFRPELEQVLINLPMAGNCYQKLIPPPQGVDIRGVSHEWISVDKMILPYSATNFYTAGRRTHVQELTAQEFQRRMRTGMYCKVESTHPMEPQETESQQVRSGVEGKERDSANTDGLRVLYEVDCLYEIKDSKVKGSQTEGLQEDAQDTTEDEAEEVGPKPYLISIDETTKQVLSIYRNWDEQDDREERLEWTVEWIFIPFNGAYALGLPHIIGGLSIAATGALRALLDKAHISNFPGLLKMKGAAGGGVNLKIGPTEVTEIPNSGEVDDIRKLIMPIPFDEPSPVLLTLLGMLGDQAEQVIRTTIEESEARGDVPVGTTLARIEQGMVAFSAIHGRLHNSMDRLLRILHRINRVYLEDEDVVSCLNEPLVRKVDFQSGYDVLPVSDPNIFCEVQRYGQIQTIAQRAVLLTQLGQPIYDLRKVEELILKQMKVPNDGKDLLVQKPEPQQMNPANENVSLSLGGPIVAFPQQDHESHITTHCDYFQNPMFSPLISSNPGAVGGLLEHLKQHVVFWYAASVHKLGSQVLTQIAKERDPKSGAVDIGDLPQTSKTDPEISQLYDKAITKVSEKVMQQAQQDQVLKRGVQVMGQLQQILQQIQPPPMMDPTQAAMAQVQADKQMNQDDNQTKQLEIQQKAKQASDANAGKAVIAQQHETHEDQRRAAQDETKLITTREDNQTALAIETSKALMGKATDVSDGEAVGKSSPK